MTDKPGSVQDEQWPDPTDVEHWLASLDEGIRLLDEERARAVAHRDACRAAATADGATTVGSEASKRLCLLMHGVDLDPAEVEEGPDDVPPWVPPTTDEHRERDLAMAKERREHSLAEQRRRVAIAERITGTRYEGLPIEELRPSLKARRAAP